MSNMSYCRFQNTLHDLIDCQDQLEAILNADTEDGDGKLSEEELSAATQLVDRCISITRLVAEHNGLYIEELDELDGLASGSIEVANDELGG